MVRHVVASFVMLGMVTVSAQDTEQNKEQESARRVRCRDRGGARRPRQHPAGAAREGRVRHRHPVGDEGALGHRRQLRPWGDGLPLGQGVRRPRGARRRCTRSKAAASASRLGGEATDLVLLVMNNRGVDALLKQQGQARRQCVGCRRTKGPHRRSVHRRDDARRDPELLRARGLFAGVSLDGTSLRPDDDANGSSVRREVDRAPHRDGRGDGVPASGQRLVDALQQARTAQRIEQDVAAVTLASGLAGAPGTPVDDRDWAPPVGPSLGAGEPCRHPQRMRLP